MLFELRHGLCCVLMIFCARVLVSVAEAEPLSGRQERLRVARSFIDAMAAGKYKIAVADFDETMTQAVSPERLAAIWEGLQRQFGPFVEFKRPSTGSVAGYETVYIETDFQRGQRRLRVVFNEANRIAGFFHELVPVRYEKSPAPYDKPGNYTERDVEFGDPAWRVKGKLTLPRTRSAVPAVVLVHGSGPHDEDETIGPNKPFRDIAVGLSSRGIAVLRYEKRTHAHKLRLVVRGSITVREEVIDDALEAVRFLRRQKGIEATGVFVLGHSLGATLAPHIAKEAGPLAGVILLAGSARDFYDILDAQLEYIASLPGPNQVQNRRAHEEARDAINRVRVGDDPGEVKILQVAASYWNEVNDYARRSVGVARELKCRMFIAGGGRDYQITKKDFDFYRDALRDRNRVTFRWYKDLNHLFVHGEGKATPGEYAVPGHVDGQLIDDLVGWMRPK